jgi:thiamine biosynthesis lipoprotein
MATQEQNNPRPETRSAIVPLLLLALGACALILRGCGGLPATPETDAIPKEPYVYEFPIFDTFAILKVWAPRKKADDMSREVRASLRGLHNRINLFDPESELSELNRTAAEKPFHCSDELWALLDECRRAWRETDGAFDVSVGPLMRLWGLHRHRETLPTDDEVKQTLELVGLDKVVFDDDAHTVSFPKPGMYLDFGGIAKGYALQLVIDQLRAHEISIALVDLGGNIAGLGTPPGRESFVIGVRNPFETDDLLGTVQVVDRAVATSGNYERQIVIQGRTIQHIVDPRTGQPVATFAGVTVITPRPVNSDIYSTAVFVAGEKLAKKLTEQDPDTGIVLVRKGDDGPDIQTFGRVKVEQ